MIEPYVSVHKMFDGGDVFDGLDDSAFMVLMALWSRIWWLLTSSAHNKRQHHQKANNSERERTHDSPG